MFKKVEANTDIFDIIHLDDDGTLRIYFNDKKWSEIKEVRFINLKSDSAYMFRNPIHIDIE